MRKKEKKKNKKILVFIAILIVVIIAGIGYTIYWEMARSKDDIIPRIDYSFNSDVKKVIEKDRVFRNKITIVWTDDCKGTIKKDKKVYSKENNTTLKEDGIYEISVSSPTGKNKTKIKVELDTTPPDVTIKQNGTVTIVFENLDDVESAILEKIDVVKNEKLESINLFENGKKNNIEVKEPGYYNVVADDEYGNSVRENFEIK